MGALPPISVRAKIHDKRRAPARKILFRFKLGGNAHVHFGPKRRHSVSYSIILSASNCIEVGTVMPRALAVLRLMTNSYLTGLCTGRSPGFSPLRIRSI